MRAMIGAEHQQDDAEDHEDHADRVVALLVVAAAATPEHEPQEEVGEQARSIPTIVTASVITRTS